jgi:putative peptidoglycan lipid II flippase
MDRYAQAGLAFATSVGAWINLALLIWYGTRQNLLAFDQRLRRSSVKLALAGGLLALVLLIAERPVTHAFASWPSLRDEATLLVLGAVGAITYGVAVLVLFRRLLRTMIGGRPGTKPPVQTPDDPGMV